MKVNRNSKTTLALIYLFEMGYRILQNGQIINGKGRVICGYKNNGGYVTITVHMGVDYVKVFAHRLMAFQKYGEAIFEPGIEVRHKDGNPSNNNQENILIGTAHQNAMDKNAEVRCRVATFASHSFHDQSRWGVIDADRHQGMSYRWLRRKHGVALGTLSYRYSLKTQFV